MSYLFDHMTLTAHGITGAAVSSLFPPQYYPLAWTASFLSHFFIDAIPHWDYKIPSTKRKSNPLDDDFILNRKSIVDLVKIGIDFFLGIFLSYLFLSGGQQDLWLVIGGAFFGILPDPLQFAYWKIRRPPLTMLQKLHIKIHSSQNLKPWPFGIPLQAITIAIILLFALTFRLTLSSLNPSP